LATDVKQTRCTTCDAEHEFKHAKVPRQRRKSDTPAALYAQVAAGGAQARRRTMRPPPGAAEGDSRPDEAAFSAAKTVSIADAGNRGAQAVRRVRCRTADEADGRR
jgi:hypothetical protein